MDTFEYHIAEIDKQLDRVVTSPAGNYDGLIAAINHLVGIVKQQQEVIVILTETVDVQQECLDHMGEIINNKLDAPVHRPHWENR